jgi:hypothetical protein
MHINQSIQVHAQHTEPEELITHAFSKTLSHFPSQKRIIHGRPQKHLK